MNEQLLLNLDDVSTPEQKEPSEVFSEAIAKAYEKEEEHPLGSNI